MKKYTDGSTYDGEWENDERNGFGTLTDQAGEIYTGTWQNDQLIKVSVA